MKLTRVKYVDLNTRQKENYNFQKVSAILADYGFSTIRLTDDWQGADFIARHPDGDTFLKVQLKGRLTIDKKYIGKDLYIAFQYGVGWFVYEHDDVMRSILEVTRVGWEKSWKTDGLYTRQHPGVELRRLLEPYRITDSPGIFDEGVRGQTGSFALSESLCDIKGNEGRGWTARKEARPDEAHSAPLVSYVHELRNRYG